jgi:crotonobetainyl-CoA:carnitine CoA-transferase CaiB-like acyl-CoA transferase
MPSLIADKTTGLHLCIAVLGALYHRKCTGEGQLVEVPMLETLASFWLTEHLFGETWTPGRGEMGYDRIINKFRHPFPTKDGYICALPYTDQHWANFFKLAGRPDLAEEKRFIDKFERPKHFSELYQILDSLLKDRTTAEWLETFDKADIPAMPVNSMEQLFDDPHLKATGFFTDREHPTEGPIKTFASPLDFEKTKVEYRRHAPQLGGDGVELLREAGVSEAEIEKLRADKVLIVP